MHTFIIIMVMVLTKLPKTIAVESEMARGCVPTVREFYSCSRVGTLDIVRVVSMKKN